LNKFVLRRTTTQSNEERKEDQKCVLCVSIMKQILHVSLHKFYHQQTRKYFHFSFYVEVFFTRACDTHMVCINIEGQCMQTQSTLTTNSAKIKNSIKFNSNVERDGNFIFIFICPTLAYLHFLEELSTQ
jgi:hypothetical protein